MKSAFGSSMKRAVRELLKYIFFILKNCKETRHFLVAVGRANGFAAINGCALIERGANCEMSSAQCADATPIGFPFAGVLDTLVKRVPLGS